MTIKRVFSLTLAVAFICTMFCTAQAQTPRMTTINITAESGKVHVSAQGDVSEMRIEVANEAGDVVFESGARGESSLPLPRNVSPLIFSMDQAMR